VFVGLYDVNTVRVSFNAPSNIGGGPVTDYRAKISNDGVNYQAEFSCGTTSYCDVAMTTLNAAPYSFTNGQTMSVIISTVNVIGSSAASTAGTYVFGSVAAAPATPSAPTTFVIGSSVVVNWPSTAVNNGAVRSVSVQFKLTDGTYQNVVACDGSNFNTVAQRSCTVPMIVFRQSPYSFTLNAAITARVTLTNSAGTSSTSADSAGTATA
jgi:hypothetical protein